jgi:hypothetical protein
LVFTGRLVIPSFVTACLLATLVFVIMSVVTSLYRDLDAAALTFFVSFLVIAGVGWVAGWGEAGS